MCMVHMNIYLNVISLNAIFQRDNILDVKLALIIGKETLEGEYKCQVSLENGEAFEFTTIIQEQVGA